MSSRVGLWIDHRQAVIVVLGGEGEKVKVVVSDVEKYVRPSGGSRSKLGHGPQDVSAEDKRQRRFEGHLDQYYGKVISSIGDAESILLFGPGVAKLELKKHMERKHLGERLVGIETVDKMTEPQIVAKVRQHFLK